jgi:hypothetical protein
VTEEASIFRPAASDNSAVALVGRARPATALPAVRRSNVLPRESEAPSAGSLPLHALRLDYRRATRNGGAASRDRIKLADTSGLNSQAALLPTENNPRPQTGHEPLIPVLRLLIN